MSFKKPPDNIRGYKYANTLFPEIKYKLSTGQQIFVGESCGIPVCVRYNQSDSLREFIFGHSKCLFFPDLSRLTGHLVQIGLEIMT
jgi:hypothetical protein